MIDWIVDGFAIIGALQVVRVIARGYLILSRLENPPPSKRESVRWVGQP